jgi:hypothetical protein
VPIKPSIEINTSELWGTTAKNNAIKIALDNINKNLTVFRKNDFCAK